MADDENGDRKKQSRTNVSPTLKPKGVQRSGYAPPGSIGNEHSTAPKPHSLGTGPDTGIAKQSGGSQPPENRPLFARTGDKDVDAHYGKTHRQVDPDHSAAKALTTEAMKTPSAQDIFNKFAHDRDQEKEKQR